MTTFVIKNDGRKEPYNVDKIKACVQHATSDLDVNPLALESKFNKVIHDGMSTDDIQANLIEHAKQMCSPTDPDWSFVAGRFETMRRWKKCHVFERTFYYYLKEQIDAGIYKHEGFKCWTKTEINRLSQEIDHNRDLYHGYGSVITGNKKYLMKGETIQHMHMANAMIIASVETKEERLDFAIEVYHALSKRKISLATPWLSNLRAGHNISSCFIIGVNDDLESISHAWTNAAMISKFGGGLGIDLGLIRASKATINGCLEASKGVIPWAKILNDIAVAVDQCFHPDTRIVTDNGVKRICDIKPLEDSIIAEDGKLHLVERKKNYTQSTPMIEIKSKYSISSEKVTTSHPIYAITGVKIGQSYSRISGKKPQWVDSGELKIGDFVGVKIPSEYTECDYSEELLRFYGIMLGDGHIVKNTGEYGISFHKTNDMHFDFVLNFLTTRNIHFWVKECDGKHCKTIRFSKQSGKNIRNAIGQYESSGILNLPEIQWDDLYDNDGNKRIHPKFLNIDPKLQLSVIKGLVETDGEIYRDNEIHFYNTSDSLVEGLRYLLLRNGVLCSGKKNIVPVTQLVGVESECYDVRIPAVDVIADLFEVKATNKSHWFIQDGYIFNRIVSIDNFEYDGDVWDLGIQSFPSYQISSFMVHNGGKRAGAFTIHVPIWHRDIEDFLEVQSENKDPRRQCFDIFPQLGIYDLFMQEQNKEDGGTWYTFCPHEVETVMGFKLTGVFGKEFNQRYRRCIRAYESGKLKNVGVYNAKSLVKIAMKTQFESGLPYLAFLDTINEANPNDHEGYIPCVNLCTESFSNVVADKYAHTCNLASVVAGRIESFEELDYITRLTTRILDNGIALTNSPIPESNAHNERYRTIGIGIQGMHDWLALNNYGYDNTKELSEFVERLQYSAVSASVDLAEKRGAYPAFKGSQWDTGKIIDKYKKNSVTDLDYDALQKKMNRVGIRNSQLTSPAPNTSTAPFMDASAGFMPVYRAFFIEDNAVGKFPVFGMHLKQNPLAYERTQPRMNQAKLTKLVGVAQKWIDTGVSAEYVFDMNNEGFSAKDLYELWNSAWKNRTKAVYYIRSIKKGKTIDSIMSGESVCAGCTG